MTVIAVLTIVVGGIELLAGLVQLVDVLDQFRTDDAIILGIRAVFGLPTLAAGVVGITAGIATLALRPRARALSGAFGGLLILTSVVLLFLVSTLTPYVIPVLASVGSFDLSADSPALNLFMLIYVAVPVAYALVLFVAFSRPAWRATFAKG
jgi:hypothetical protein